MGVIIDIVLNYMGVVGGGNVWWCDVFEKGEVSLYVWIFDIDWCEWLVFLIFGDLLLKVILDGVLIVEWIDGLVMLVVYGEYCLLICVED